VEEADEEESSCAQRRAIAAVGTRGAHGRGHSGSGRGGDASTEVRKDEDDLCIEARDVETDEMLCRGRADNNDADGAVCQSVLSMLWAGPGHKLLRE
jgi:hypothetical protein